MINLDFTKIDLIVENSHLKLDLLKHEFGVKERIVYRNRRVLGADNSMNELARRQISSQQNAAIYSFGSVAQTLLFACAAP